MTEKASENVALDDEQEWTLGGFMADCERVATNPPPAPEGFELVGCDAEPRHWPTYMAHVDGMYPAPCRDCMLDEHSKAAAKRHCQDKHRRWKSWDIWYRLASRLYVLGITSGGGGTSFGRCEHCGIGKQHHAPRFRGRRVYVLGKPREWWSCLRRGHIYSPLQGRTFHLCSVCLPCSTCGSTDPMHTDSVDCVIPPASEVRDA
ncbi:MAG: hypothetical protein EPO65_00495 [Dehalococcoidia bacterium]|nr:MAG: hypothetical protein EPO65_00495 [Dehalococcoidia bacterium]